MKKTIIITIIAFIFISCAPEVTEQTTYINDKAEPEIEVESTPEPSLTDIRYGTATLHDEFGAGSSSDPFLIYNSDQLVNLSTECSKTVSNACSYSYQLEKHIEMDQISFNSIGGTYSGVFNGNSKKILNLTISGGTNDYIGLFSKIDGTIKNLILENAVVSGNIYVGTVAGEINSGHLDSVTTITGTASGSSHIGGLVGLMTGSTALNCFASVTVSGTQIIGGLMGEITSASTVDNCSASGDVSSTGKWGAAGLISWNRGYSTINNSFATGNVTGVTRLAGLVSYNEAATINTSYATGDITASTNGTSMGLMNGGLVAQNVTDGFIYDSYATGDVSSDGNRTGGLVGFNEDAFIDNSYAIGQVTGDQDVGGLVGRNGGGCIVGAVSCSSVINNSFSTGNVTGNQSVGGLSGYSGERQSIINSYASGTISGCTLNCGDLVGEDVTTTIEVSFGAVDASDFFDSSHAVYNDADTPWDTTTIWTDISGTYPTLR